MHLFTRRPILRGKWRSFARSRTAGGHAAVSNQLRKASLTPSQTSLAGTRRASSRQAEIGSGEAFRLKIGVVQRVIRDVPARIRVRAARPQCIGTLLDGCQQHGQRGAVLALKHRLDVHGYSRTHARGRGGYSERAAFESTRSCVPLVRANARESLGQPYRARRWRRRGPLSRVSKAADYRVCVGRRTTLTFPLPPPPQKN